MKLHKDNIPFTMVANEVLNRPDLSLKAKGMYAYLFSKPDGWDFSSMRIKNDHADGRHATLEALKELETAGLLSRVKHPNGRMEYRIGFASQSPKSGLRLFGVEPKSGNRTVRKSHSAKTEPVNKKEEENKKEIIKTDGGNVTNELIGLFRPVNPTYARLYANKSQRAAVERMTGQFGAEKVKNAVLAAVQAFGKPYAPTITTPVQLEAKMGQLGAYLRRGVEKSGGGGVLTL